MMRLMLPLPRFLSPREVFTGTGTINALRALGAVRTSVLASAPILEDDELVKKIRKAIGSLLIQLLRVPNGEPILTRLEPLLAEISAFRPDWIIAIGGGAAIDTGKLAWILYEHPGIDRVSISRAFALPPLRGKARFAALPTTSGSGSEVSSAAVYQEHKGAGKKMVVSHELLPDVVVLDPTLTLGLPKHAIAASGMDALSHAVEGYVSRFSNPLVDIFAEDAVRLIFEWLPHCLRQPGDLNARLQMMIAAMLGGWVQNIKLPGIGHAIAHQLGALGISHGMAAGIMLCPAIMTNMSNPGVKAKYDQLAARVGLSGTGELLAKIENLATDIGFSQMAQEALEGVRESIVSRKGAFIDLALKDPCARANPVSLDAERLAGLIEHIL